MPNEDKVETIWKSFFANQYKLRAYVYAATYDFHATEEIVQSMAIIVAKKINTVEIEKDAVSWFFGIAKNLIMQWRTKKARQKVVFNSELMDAFEKDLFSQPDHVETEEISALKTCVEGLPPKTRKIIEMRYTDEMSCDEIAKRTERSIHTIYTTLKRMKIELRKCVEKRTRLLEATT